MELVYHFIRRTVIRVFACKDILGKTAKQASLVIISINPKCLSLFLVFHFFQIFLLECFYKFKPVFLREILYVPYTGKKDSFGIFVACFFDIFAPVNVYSFRKLSFTLWFTRRTFIRYQLFPFGFQ